MESENRGSSRPLSLFSNMVASAAKRSHATPKGGEVEPSPPPARGYTGKAKGVYIVACRFDVISVYTCERGCKQIVHFPGRTLRDVLKAGCNMYVCIFECVCIMYIPCSICIMVKRTTTYMVYL